MPLLKTTRQIGRTIRNAGRVREIVGVFARHGFHNVAERVNLGRFVLARLNAAENIEKYSVAERMRMSFEELGPTFVKLGQLLASRPDLVPEDFTIEFAKLHDNVQPLPFATIEKVLEDELGPAWREKFSEIDSKPLGSASIAQVHRATLSDGVAVVIKVQRPGILAKINDDLSVLYMLAELLEQYLPETRNLNPVGIVDEYFKTLQLETNFVVEANNLRRFHQNFSHDPDVHIPSVHLHLTTEKVLTMEALSGLALSSPQALVQDGVLGPEVIRKGLQAYLKMIFVDGLFHGDLHAGNFFVYPHNGIGFVDFGVVGRLNSRTKNAVSSMLLALSREDYDQLAYEFVDLAEYNERVDVDVFARELRNLLAPYFGLTLKNVNLGHLLLSAGSSASRNGVSVPSDLMLFFKSIVGIEGLGKKIQPDFDFLSTALEFSADLVKAQYSTSQIWQDFSQSAKDSKTLINTLPRQVLYALRRSNSPHYATKTRIENLHELRASVEKSFRLLFLAILISALIFTSAFVMVNAKAMNEASGDAPTFALIALILAIILGFFATLNYFRK